MFSAHRLTVMFCIALLSVTASAASPTLLVVPARQPLVNLSLDVGDYFPRELAIVAYHDRTSVSDGGLFLWDRMAWDWRPLSGQAWRQVAGGRGVPVSVILAGRRDWLPPGLMDGVAAADVVRIESYDLVELVNALHRKLHFSPRQWKQLAAEHRLVIMNVNKGRTRGRYGRSSEARPDIPVEFIGEQMPAPVVIEPVEAVEPVIDPLSSAPPRASVESRVTTLDVVEIQPEVTSTAQMRIRDGEVIEMRPAAVAVTNETPPAAVPAAVEVKAPVTESAPTAVPLAPPPGLVDEVMAPPDTAIIDIPPEDK